MSDNPYQAPEADVRDEPTVGSQRYELATRGQRLSAHLLDALMFVVAFIPVLLPEFQESEPSPVFAIIGGVLTLVLLAVNLRLVATNQQTLGKRIMKIKIVRKDYSPCSFWRIVLLRMIVIYAIGAIPLIGSIFGLLDPLLIFRKSQYCLHDDIADTIVVKAG